MMHSKQTYQQFLLLIVTIVLTVAGLISCFTVSQSFTDAIDAATNEYVSSDAWKEQLIKHGLVYFGAPSCFSPRPEYPRTFDFASNEMVLCYEHGAGSPWESLHQTAGSFLVNTLNKRYGLNLSHRFLVLDTSEKGYFPTLQTVVDNGTCTVAIASTNYDNMRAQRVHFQCRYGGSSQGWIRSSLNSTLFKIDKESDLNQTGLTIALYKGSTHDTYATQHFTASTIIRTSGNAESFSMIMNEKVHVMIGDATDLYSFLLNVNTTNGECKECYTKAFSDAYNFGSFTTGLIKSGSLGMQVGGLLIMILFLMYSLVM